MTCLGYVKETSPGDVSFTRPKFIMFDINFVKKMTIINLGGYIDYI